MATMIDYRLSPVRGHRVRVCLYRLSYNIGVFVVLICIIYMLNVRSYTAL